VHETRALSLHEIRRPIEMFSQNFLRMERVERGRASAHVGTKIAGNLPMVHMKVLVM